MLVWYADAEYWETPTGEAVPFGDERGVRVLVGKGSAMPFDEAVAYGLIAHDGGAPATTNKAVRSPADVAPRRRGRRATK